MRTHYLTILRDTERRAKIALRTQNLENGSPYHGAFSQPDGVYQAKYAIYQAASLIAVYVNKESVYYHDPVVLESIHKGLDYVDRVQHENGQIPTHWMNTENAEQNFWFNCMFHSCRILEILSEYQHAAL